MSSHLGLSKMNRHCVIPKPGYIHFPSNSDPKEGSVLTRGTDYLYERRSLTSMEGTPEFKIVLSSLCQSAKCNEACEFEDFRYIALSHPVLFYYVVLKGQRALA